jgi:uncharacterized membrane protein
MRGVTATGYGTIGNSWLVLAVILVVAIAALVIYTMVKRPTRFAATEPPEDDAHRELRYRYEHGEIDLDTYQRLRTELDREQRSLFR